MKLASEYGLRKSVSIKSAKSKETRRRSFVEKGVPGIWETAIKKYSDSAHFVYELLQNADDTKATWVEFAFLAEQE